MFGKPRQDRVRDDGNPRQLGENPLDPRSPLRPDTLLGCLVNNLPIPPTVSWICCKQRSYRRILALGDGALGRAREFGYSKATSGPSGGQSSGFQDHGLRYGMCLNQARPVDRYMGPNDGIGSGRLRALSPGTGASVSEGADKTADSGGCAADNAHVS
jgi:hypothetical protein